MDESAEAYRQGKPIPSPKHSDANAAKVREAELKLGTLDRALEYVERDTRAAIAAKREEYQAEIASERADSLDTARQALGTLSTSLSRIGGLDGAARFLAGSRKLGGGATVPALHSLATVTAALDALGEGAGDAEA